jgi:tetratricopeptide (TPR) repeat protein/transcriptional regulator with XRE-family HTH domain
MTADSEFGAWLRAGRRAAGLSQQELAERAGLSVRAISNLERARARWPHPDTVHRLAGALGLAGPARAEFAAAAGRRLAGAPAGPATRAAADERSPAGEGRVVPRQLPGPVRQFTGRDDELAALTGLLDNGHGTAPAMVISAVGGTAGVGKTALVVHWAHHVADRFPDGQLYVNLRGYDSGPPMPAGDALAGFLRALGMAAHDIPSDTGERAAAYRSLLAGRQVLVLLDNACQAEQVRPLLPGSPGCMTVVTSRDALAGLAACDGAVRLDVDLLPLPEAVNLLRALVGARVDAEPKAADALAGLCARLPLALRIAAELAVTQPDRPLAALSAELAEAGDRLELLDAGGDPHGAVASVFSWSYRHLADATARAFRLLGLHPGADWDRYAAAALTNTSLTQAAQLLAELARAHLIRPAGAGRYGMHDLLRAYAAGLAAAHDSDEARREAVTRLFDYYLHTAAAAMDAAFPAERHRRPAVPPAATSAPGFTGAAAALAWLAAELPTVAAVTGHAAEHGWPGYATQLASTLFRYLDTGGHFPQAITIHTHAARAARRISDWAAEGDALIGLGLVDGHQGRHQHATGHFERALARYRQASHLAGQARALNYLGLIQCQQGCYRQAVGNLRQAAGLFQAAGEPTGAAYALSNLGVLGLRQGNYQQAADHQRQALALFRGLGDHHGQASVLDRLGALSLQQGNRQQASSQLRQALAIYHRIGDRQGQAGALARLGLASLRQGRYPQAASQLNRALACYQDMGDPSGQAIARSGLGEMLLAAGRPAAARAQYAAAAGLAARAGEKYEQARAHHGLATAAQASGDPAGARHSRDQALALYIELGAPEADQLRTQHASGPSGQPNTARGLS